MSRNNADLIAATLANEILTVSASRVNGPLKDFINHPQTIGCKAFLPNLKRAIRKHGEKKHAIWYPDVDIPCRCGIILNKQGINYIIIDIIRDDTPQPLAVVEVILED